MYKAKQREEIDAEMSKCIDSYNFNKAKIDKIRGDRNKSVHKQKEESKKFNEHIKYLRAKMPLLQEIKDFKTPIQEKLPTMSNFTKLFISRLKLKRIRDAVDEAKNEHPQIKDVNETILKPTIEFAEIQRHALEQARRRREQVKTMSLLEEILQY